VVAAAEATCLAAEQAVHVLAAAEAEAEVEEW
jgi:hypothetical protein